jgi:hypothetical protein
MRLIHEASFRQLVGMKSERGMTVERERKSKRRTSKAINGSQITGSIPPG